MLSILNFAHACCLEHSYPFQPIKVIGGGIRSRSPIQLTQILTESILDPSRM